MDRDETGFVPREGMKVIGSDGEKVGTIDLVDRSYVIVRRGLFPQDYYVSLSAIASHDDDAVYLSITKDEALERGLGNPAVAFSDEEPVSTASVSATASDDVSGSEPGEAFAVDDTPAATTIGAPEGIDTAPATALPEDVTDEGIIAADVAGRTESEDEMHRTVELYAEEAVVHTRPVERGVVRVEKRVVEEEQTFEVPLVEEEVIVTRRRVDKELPDPDAAFTEERLELPIRGQEVEIEKRAHLVEEVDISKTAHQRIERVTETVRHEEARIEGDDVEVDADAALEDLPDDERL